MHYYEVWVADGHYHGNDPLTYSSELQIKPGSVVSVPLRSRLVTGFVAGKVSKPAFAAKPIKGLLSESHLPAHCLEMTVWLKDYYHSTHGEALRQFAPSLPSARRPKQIAKEELVHQQDLNLDDTLTNEQTAAIAAIKNHPGSSVLLHGDTGSGKTRVYLEIAAELIKSGKSVIILTPEIALTAQLEKATRAKLAAPVYILHSELSQSDRKKTWFEILEAKKPLIVIGPRSALFAPIHNLGLIIVDEAHEPAYKQEQSPRYFTPHVASQLAKLTGAKVILGSATPSISEYYLADKHEATVRMRLQARSGQKADVESTVLDLRDKANFNQNRYLSNAMIAGINKALAAGEQCLIYFNRRGSARLILCDRCGWQMLCPHCDIPMVYHGDKHEVRCHICGRKDPPPLACPNCANPDVIYTSIGTKTLMGLVESLFPNARVGRFDSDNVRGERLNEVYDEVKSGQIDILVGTQLIAKGLDLPKLGFVGIISAETSLALPDYTAEERTFQLLYQVMGRVGRHQKGRVVIQSWEPDSPVIKAAIARDYSSFYEHTLKERQAYRFPPYSYLMQLVCRRTTLTGAQTAAEKLKVSLASLKLPVEIVGPAPSFYGRRGKYFYYQVVVKAKDRKHLIRLSDEIPSGWSIDLDPLDLI